MSARTKRIISAFIIVITTLNVVFGIQPQQHGAVSSKSSALFPVLFDSPRVLIVRKPHGIGHHDETSPSSSMPAGEESSESMTPGVLSLLRKERRQQTELGERLYGVHRLDKVTSGILVLAKDPQSASTLSDYFAKGEIQKVYFGLSAKKPQKKKQGLVQGGMTRSRNKSWKLVRNPKNAPKGPVENFAKTRFFTTGFQVVDAGSSKNVDSSNLDSFASNVRTVAMFRPYTGRTHQLRVAAKAMGIPLLGDPIYKDGGNGNKGSGGDNAVATATRTMLHASGIHIPEFLDQEEINVWCPPTFFDDNNNESFAKIEDLEDGGGAKKLLMSYSLDMAVEKLMTKNCDVPGILEMMTMQGQNE